MSHSVFDGFLSTPQMQQLFSPVAIVQAMMDFEAALARAEARCGVIPHGAAQAISSLCRAELYDVTALVAASNSAGSLAIPLVRKLSETVALFDPAAAAYVHWGSTSQDVIDTAMVLQTRRALQLIESDLLALAGHLLDLADNYPATPLLARTLMQPAAVSSLRARACHWVLPLIRCAQALRQAGDAALQLQFGGAVGTLATLGEQADAVTAALAEELRLPAPAVPWHTQRDRWVRLGAELGVLCGSVGKLAQDLALLAQPELGEMAETSEAGRGGSSAMPHKRNPVFCMQALAAARRAPQRVAGLLACMTQEHERGLGNWQAELAEWSGLLLSVHGAVQSMAQALAAPRVDAARMRANIEAQRGLVFAEGLALLLAPLQGKAAAQALVEALCARVVAGDVALPVLARQLLKDEPALDAGALEAQFDVHRIACHADSRVDAALNGARQQWSRLHDTPHW